MTDPTSLRLQGIGCVNATPLRADGTIDEAEYRRHVRFLADAGITFLQPAAATGQALETTEHELRALLEWTVDEVGDRVWVTAYTGRDSTAETIRLTRMAADAGAHAAYLIQPYFSRPDAEGLFRHYAAVAEAVDLPLVFYNNPDRAGVQLPDDVMARLATRHPQFVGLKQADLLLFADSYRTLSDHFHVMPKSEKEMLFGFTLGSRAVLTFAANVVPAELVAVHRAFQAGDLETARAGFLAILPLMNAIHLEPVPGAVKYMLNRMGWNFGEPRLPGHPLSTDNAARVDQLLADLGKLGSGVSAA